MSAPSRTDQSKVAPAIGGDFGPRLVSAAVLAALALVAAYFGGWPATVVTAAIVATVHVEWVGLTEGAMARAVPFTFLVVAVVVIIGAGFPGFACLLAAAGAVGAGMTRGVWRPLGVVYSVLLGFGLLLLRLSPDFGLAAIVFLFAVVWATDAGAYFAGRVIGGPKLWAAVSPKKTRSGAVGGLAAGLLAGVAMAIVSGVPLTLGLAAVAIVLSIASQAGDLFESWVKRRFDAKDAGTIIPGHGGMMDRVDGLIAASVVAVALGWLNSSTGGLAEGLLLW